MKSAPMLLLLLAASAGAAAQGVSGSWYNPLQSGHGLAIDETSPSSSLLLWFAYDAEGEPMPLYVEAERGADGEFAGQAYAPFGPRFGDWDPAELQFEPWGRLSFEPQACDRGTLRWNSEAFGAGATPMRLLAYSAGTACPHVTLPAMRLGGLSGTWYHPQLQGASVNVQVIDGQSALAYWYTYGADGMPKPLYIQGRFTAGTLAGQALAPHGMKFGSFRREDLEVQDFGEVSIDFHDCSHAMLFYETPLGRGALPLVRLTQLEDVACGLPSGLPADLPRHFVGTHDRVLDSMPISAMLTSRDELLIWMDGKVRRGFFRPNINATLQARFDDGTEAGLFRATPERLSGYLGGGVTGRGLELHSVAVRTDGLAGMLVGTWSAGQPSPIATQGAAFIIGADGTLTYTDQWRAVARGRIGRIDEARGSFDFDLRFEGPEANNRVIGSGRVLGQGTSSGRLELFGTTPDGGSFYKTVPRLNGAVR